MTKKEPRCLSRRTLTRTVPIGLLLSVAPADLTSFLRNTVKAGNSPSPEEYLPEGALSHWTEMEPADMMKSYSEEPAESSTLQDGCEIIVYPRGNEATQAESTLYRREDLITAPRYVLVQEFRYPTVGIAHKTFGQVVGDSREILRLMNHLADDDIREHPADENTHRFEATTYSGWVVALEVVLEGTSITVLRAKAPSIAPWTILENAREAHQASENGSSFRFDGNTWEPTYGPIDIHPSILAPIPCS